MQANKHRSERSFAVGDMVYLKLQPYIQTSIATRASHKLSFHYLGPYPVIAKVGAVAYKLQLPEHTNIHPVFHVSLLKKALPSTTQVSSGLPVNTKTNIFRIPVKVLQRRVKHDGDGIVSEVLVQWSSWPPSMATWELEDELKKQFPAAPAWGQAGFQDRRNVKILGTKDTEGEAAADIGPGAVKPKRTLKPNPLYSGSDWVVR